MGVRRTTNTARTSPKQIAMAKRRALVLNLRERGLGFHEIAHQVGISVATAHRDVVAGMAEITREPARELLTLELLRLDELQRGFYVRAVNGNKRALNACLRIMDRRARLLGLYDHGSEDDEPVPRAPTVKVTVGGKPLELEPPFAT
jgi:hypothetical protein